MFRIVKNLHKINVRFRDVFQKKVVVGTDVGQRVCPVVSHQMSANSSYFS